MRTQTYVLGVYQYVEAMNIIEVLKDHPGVCLGRVSFGSKYCVCVLQDLFDWDRGEGLNIKQNLHPPRVKYAHGGAAVSK